jgi:lipopolysaccharide export system permease protein
MFLRHTTNYILSLLLWPTVLITFCLSGIVWLMQAVRFIDFIINRGLSVTDFLYLTILLLPSLIAYILPIALVIAIILTYHRLIADSELVAMQASGYSRWQLTRPALIASVIVAGLIYVLTLNLLPHANREFKNMREFFKQNYASIMLQEEVFNHPIDGITVFISKRGLDGKLKGILVHDSRNPQNTITMMAKQAALVQSKSGPKFLLEDGIRQEMRQDEKNGGKLSWLSFASYNLDLSYYTKRNLERKLSEGELTTQDLWQNVQLGKIDGNPKNSVNIIELNWRLAWPPLVILLSIITVANLTAGQFQRRGIWKKLCSTSALVGFAVIGFFFFLNLIDGSQSSIITLYIYIGLLFMLGMLRNVDWRRRVSINS